MAKSFSCDVCGKPTEKIVGKLQYVPAEGRNGSRRMTHSNYSHHADVGVCCADKLLRLFKFRPRMTRAEYLESRRS